MTSTSTTEDDLDKALDDIVLVEEKAYQQGFEEGVQKGKIEAACEGGKIGVQLGTQLGSELGFYQGYLSVLKKYMIESHTKGETGLLSDSKKLTQCEHLIEALNNFPRSNVDSEDFLQKAKEIRNQFKRLKQSLFPEDKESQEPAVNTASGSLSF